MIEAENDELTPHVTTETETEGTGSTFGHKHCDGECPATGDQCDKYMVLNEKYKGVLYYCDHPESQRSICTSVQCPLCTEGTGSDDGCS